MRLSTPQPAPSLCLYDIDGEPLVIGGHRRPALLSFFREASCPFCNFRVYELTHNFPTLAALNLEVIAVFSSGEDEVRRFIAKKPRPFRIVANPENHGHRIYGIERSLPGKLRAVLTRMPALLRGLSEAGLSGGRAGTLMPADFLIDAQGQVVEAYYGRDAGDHIPIARIERFAAAQR